MNKTRKIKQYCFLFACFIGVVVLMFIQNKVDRNNDILSNIKVKTENKFISITWDVPINTDINRVIIEVKDINENILKTYDVKPYKEEFMFKDGEISNAYIFVISVFYMDGTFRELVTEKRLYLDMDTLSEIPIMNINTRSGDDPTTDYIYAPENYMGSTLKNNDYLEGTMSFVAYGKEIESKLEIKLRGNSSAINTEKKPYKIVLNNSLDLLNLGNEFSHKNWILLKSGDQLNNYLGQTIGEGCGLEWVPHSIFVNVFLNGDYKGIYTLCEEVSQESSHSLVSENGYIFESDAYIWDENGVYFQLDGQKFNMGYTFKYPKIEYSNDERINMIHDYMQNALDLALENSKDAYYYWDFDNLASYMIAKDILYNISDKAGANVFYYIKDFDSKTNKDKVIKMGPLWDFDFSFAASFSGGAYANTHGFCGQHSYNWIPIVDSDLFNQAYVNKWYEISDDLLNYLHNSLDDLYLSSCDAINQSRYLDSLRWSDGTYQTLDEEIVLAKKWIDDQIDWLNENVKGLNDVSG